MDRSSIYRARLIGTGSGIPQKVLTNADLEKMVETSDEWIRTRTGIQERRVAEEHEATSDLAITAARAALKDAGIAASELNAIFVCTCTPDMVFPSVACLVQDALKADQAFAMDLSAACSGFLYGLATVKAFIESGMIGKALLIGVDTLSKVTNWQDRSTCVLFGDGAGAAVFSREQGEAGIHSVYLGADASHWQMLQVPAGGSRRPITAEVLDKKLHTIQMDGQEVYKNAVLKMAEAAEKAMQAANLQASQIKLVIPHQANLRIIDSVAKRLKLSSDQVFVNVQKYGNMSAATTAIALDEARKSGRLQAGDWVELVAFGAGLTWGACVLQN